MVVQSQKRGESMSPPETNPVNDSVLIAKVTQTIAPMSDDGSPVVPAAPAPTRKLAIPVVEPDPTPAVPDSVESTPRAPVPKAVEPVVDDGPPAIPENYIAAAKHQGISDADVASMYELNPQGTVDYLKNVYESTNKLSQSFANLGRKQQEINASATKAVETPVASATVDLSKLEERYGADDPMVEVARQQNARIVELESRKVSEPQTNQGSVDAATVSLLDSFFGSDNMQPFQNFYGVVENGDWSALNAGEFAQRNEVIGMAERMIIGAQTQGEQMPLDQALGLAHLSVSGGMREQAVRAQIKGEIKTKAKGVTLAPSSSTPAGDPGLNADGTKTQAQLEADTAARLQRLNAGQPVRG